VWTTFNKDKRLPANTVHQTGADRSRENRSYLVGARARVSQRQRVNEVHHVHGAADPAVGREVDADDHGPHAAHLDGRCGLRRPCSGAADSRVTIWPVICGRKRRMTRVAFVFWRSCDERQARDNRVHV